MALREEVIDHIKSRLCHIKPNPLVARSDALLKQQVPFYVLTPKCTWSSDFYKPTYLLPASAGDPEPLLVPDQAYPCGKIPLKPLSSPSSKSKSTDRALNWQQNRLSSVFPSRCLIQIIHEKIYCAKGKFYHKDSQEGKFCQKDFPVGRFCQKDFPEGRFCHKDYPEGRFCHKDSPEGKFYQRDFPEGKFCQRDFPEGRFCHKDSPEGKFCHKDPPPPPPRKVLPSGPTHPLRKVLP